jgi:hypothetical protein
MNRKPLIKLMCYVFYFLYLFALVIYIALNNDRWNSFLLLIKGNFRFLNDNNIFAIVFIIHSFVGIIVEKTIFQSLLKKITEKE